MLATAQPQYSPPAMQHMQQHMNPRPMQPNNQVQWQFTWANYYRIDLPANTCDSDDRWCVCQTHLPTFERHFSSAMLCGDNDRTCLRPCRSACNSTLSTRLNSCRNYSNVATRSWWIRLAPRGPKNVNVTFLCHTNVIYSSNMFSFIEYFYLVRFCLWLVMVNTVYLSGTLYFSCNCRSSNCRTNSSSSSRTYTLNNGCAAPILRNTGS